VEVDIPMRIDYERYVQEALQGVVRRILSEVAHSGVKDPHHFYITFRTRYPGVDLPDFVVEENPDDVTIVLQHQFWDLEVTDKAFRVKLYFQEHVYNICVPFYALLSFMDPESRFGLQFTPPSLEELACVVDLPLTPRSESLDQTPKEGKVVFLDAFRPKSS